jgi:hypothetical protein
MERYLLHLRCHVHVVHNNCSRLCAHFQVIVVFLTQSGPTLELGLCARMQRFQRVLHIRAKSLTPCMTQISVDGAC